MNLIVETERLIVRPWGMDDAEALFELCSDAEVMLHIGTGEPYRNREEAHRWLERAVSGQKQHGFSRWAVIEKASGKIIGSCGYSYLYGGPDIELGYLFARASWGQGYATEAACACLRYGFEKLNLQEVCAITDPHHTASQRVLEKLGFTCQGLRRFGDEEDMFYVATRKGKE